MTISKDFNAQRSTLNAQPGFTFIEMLVVLGIISVLSTTLFFYSKTGERQIVLFKDQARVQSALARAKSLAVGTYGMPAPTGESRPACGYGVNFAAPRTVTIYADLSEDCAASSYEYAGTFERVESFDLDNRLVFDGLDVRDVFFLPPDPRVFLFPDAADARIPIKIQGSITKAVIRITKAGQISAE